MKNTYRFAEKIVEIDSLFPDVHEYCRKYQQDGAPDFAVSITNDDILYEKEKSARADIAKGIAVRKWNDGYLEELSVYRKIAEKMPLFDTFLFHGSAVSVDGNAYLFTAKSGTGKSTHAALWRKLLGERAVMVNDDKPLIRISGDEAVIYGTPYSGKHRLDNPIAVKLKAVCMLERAEINHIEAVSAEEVYPLLMQQTYRPQDKMSLLKTIELTEKLKKAVSFYRLGCNMQPQAAELSYNTMKG